MRKISIGLLAIIGLTWAYIAYAQTSRETIEKRKMETYIELGSGDFSIVDNVNITSGELSVGHTGASGYNLSVEIEPNGFGARFYDSVNDKTPFRFTQENTDAATFYMRNDSTDAIKLNADGDSYFNGGNVGVGATPQSFTDLYVYSPLAADDDVVLRVENGSTSGGKDSWIDVKNSASGRDAGFRVSRSGATDFYLGIDAADNDFKIGRNSLSATSLLINDSTGKAEIEVREDGDCGIGNVCSGAYTATIDVTGATCTTSPPSGGRTAWFMRVGDQVWVRLNLSDIQCNTNQRIAYATLPFSTNLTGVQDLFGNGQALTPLLAPVIRAWADTTNNRAGFDYMGTNMTGDANAMVTFMYKIQ